MTNKEWMDANTEWIEAIRNETPVMVSNNNCDWYEPCIPIGFSCGNAGSYNYQTRDDYWAYWKPAPKKIRRAKGPVEIMKTLVEHGYGPDGNGNWVENNYGTPFVCAMWLECGKDISDSKYYWEPEWTEEVEE